jgi:hypothetical protein
MGMSMAERDKLSNVFFTLPFPHLLPQEKRGNFSRPHYKAIRHNQQKLRQRAHSIFPTFFQELYRRFLPIGRLLCKQTFYYFVAVIKLETSPSFRNALSC